MADETTAPVIGDGVVTIEIPAEPLKGKTMATDLPDGVGQLLMVETTGNLQASNRNSRGVFDAVMGALAGTVQTNFAEVGVVEGRSVSGVLATPIAAPANGGP